MDDSEVTGLDTLAEAGTGGQTNAAARAFAICTTPRTGSYLLSEGLEGAGCLGVPREYFDEHVNKAKWWIDRLAIKADADYFEKVVAHGSTPNGMFGLKIHWFQIPDLLNRYAQSTGIALPPETDLDDCLRRRFTSVHYLWLRRRNKIAQGISLHRAFQTGVWHIRPDAPPEPPAGAEALSFNAEEIEGHIRTIEDHDRQWHEFFKRKGLRPLVLIYEDFVSSRETYERTIRGVCKYIGLPIEGLPIRAPAFRQQADALSLAWEREYRELKNLPVAVRRLRRPLLPQVTVVTRPSRPGLSRRLPAASPGTDPVPTASAAAERAPPASAGSAAAVPTAVLLPAPAGPVAPAGEPVSSSEASPAPAPPRGDLSMTAYDLNPGLGVRIATASPRREWMDATPNHFVYRCLPLVIANQHGWLLLVPNRITAYWTGGTSLDSLIIDYPPDEKRRFALSHFGIGILTFSMNFIFRTPPGYNLHVRGPANMPKDGICPLEGIVETDWSEATFTMNWKMTRPNHPVVFEKDEPFAMLTPVARGVLEQFRPEIRPASDDPELEAGYRAWARSRSAFNEGLKIKDSEAQKKGWERHYVRGETVSQRRAQEHQTALSLREFTDKRE